MTYKLHLYLEDEEGGSWDEDAEFDCPAIDEDTVIDEAIACACEAFGPSYDAKMQEIPGPVSIRAEVDGLDCTIYISDNGDDISIY